MERTGGRRRKVELVSDVLPFFSPCSLPPALPPLTALPIALSPLFYTLLFLRNKKQTRQLTLLHDSVQDPMPDHGHPDPRLLSHPAWRRLDLLQRSPDAVDLRHSQVVVLEGEEETICGEDAFVGVEEVGFSKRERSFRLIRVEEGLGFSLEIGEKKEGNARISSSDTSRGCRGRWEQERGEGKGREEGRELDFLSFLPRRDG